MKKNIAVITGDGIGPEVTQQSVKVLEAIAGRFNHEFKFTYCLMGAIAIDETGDSLPNETLEVCLSADAIFLGAIGHPKYDNDPEAKITPEQGLLKLRNVLQLFANITPLSLYPTLHHLSPLKSKNVEGVDMVIFRELTGGIYYGDKKKDKANNWASDENKYNKEEIERIGHMAFKSAQKRRKKLTLIDKANVLETSKLWRKVIQDMALQYKDVKLNFLFAENAAIQMLLNPKQFDVILTENLLGDILSSEARAICGSVGLLPSASLGNSIALFEPLIGPCTHIAGKDISNPVGAILSAAMMLDYFNLNKEAQLIRDAVQWTIGSLFVSKDIDPINFYFTSTIGELVCEYISGRISGRVNKENIELRKSTII